MAIEIIDPTDKAHWLAERAKDITSTEVAALFGISPYTTRFELWFRKKEGVVVEIEENERMKWGTRLQDAIAAGIAEEQGWTIRRMNEYIRDHELRIGASFDFSIEDHKDVALLNEIQKALLEIKNVDSLQFKKEWTENDDGTIEGPLHIEIQVQHQLAVSGRQFAYLGVLVGGNKLYLLRRERNENVISKIKIKVAEFWKSIDDNVPPEPDFQVDSSFIASLYGHAEPGSFLDATNDLEIEAMAAEYKEWGDKEKFAEAKKKELKARLLIRIGDVEKVIGEGFSISAGVIEPTWVEAYEKKGYRNFRINWKKEKA